MWKYIRVSKRGRHFRKTALFANKASTTPARPAEKRIEGAWMMRSSNVPDKILEFSAK